jgi:hypothetical protein
MINDKDKFFAELTKTGEQVVRENLTHDVYGAPHKPKAKMAKEWLRQLETSRSEEILERQEEREEKAIEVAREANAIARDEAAAASRSARWAKYAAIIAAIAATISITSVIVNALLMKK